MDRWDTPTTRLLILVLGSIAILWIFATKFDATELKVVGGLLALFTGDKYDLHTKVWKLIQGKKKPASEPEPEPAAAVEDEEQ